MSVFGKSKQTSEPSQVVVGVKPGGLMPVPPPTVVMPTAAAETRAMRYDLVKAALGAAATMSATPQQIAHMAVQIADAVIAELAKEKA